MGDKQAVYVLPENVQRMMGQDAQRNNILAARIIADTVKTTLGPRGMDKMLVDSGGNIVITNDGVTILEKMDIEHPAAKMMVEIAKTQEDEVGDGTTTAVMIAGKLLENAESLLDKKIHPTVITKGYQMASEQSLSILKEIALRVTTDDTTSLKQIAMTSMTGKGVESAKERFADIIVNAVKQIEDYGKINLDNVKIEKVKGDSIKETSLISGIVLDSEKLNIEMPKIIENSKIAIIDFPLELRSPEIETKINISTPEQLQGFIDSEERALREMIQIIRNIGANVVFCQKGIDDVAQYYLTKAGVYACRRISRSDIEKLSMATGARIVSNLNELSSDDLGSAKRVEEMNAGEKKMTYVSGCINPKAVTILIRGGSDHVLDEVERGIRDSLGDVSAVLKDGMVVAGGGAVEIELAKRLREFSQSLPGREQLAVEEFANAIESIPIALSENAGLDPIDILTELKAVHESTSGNGKNAGLNLFTNKIEDTFKAGIIEPLKVKTQAISSATEVATMILRIDDVIAANTKKPSYSDRPLPNKGFDFE
ncbi:thermosome subunit [Candidatus Pacearchaeota archaeon CG10_big_fil_rev_8_21_14_0_10_31_9]|nr:MAG: thermosome subunit [Candidatus Pacearchaeota archaeon CG1_02_32_21]PIN92701.1 MAG: thermosome subunit [Candidatus Pacearchaeota archaeon CG10_big_fil_rev_8_21_14_0_10_31_9]PIZ83879.1 MAG: thermosome subunit [Candidatus Pacearchaeota archaeon CG_4_10_14_0_2_um_filter_05_32_18]